MRRRERKYRSLIIRVDLLKKVRLACLYDTPVSGRPITVGYQILDLVFNKVGRCQVGNLAKLRFIGSEGAQLCLSVLLSLLRTTVRPSTMFLRILPGHPWFFIPDGIIVKEK